MDKNWNHRLTIVGAAATAIDSNKCHHHLKTSALGDLGTDTPLSLDSESYDQEEVDCLINLLQILIAHLLGEKG